MGVYEINIEKLLIYAWVGIHPHEQCYQPIIFDIVIELEGELGKDYDKIGCTVDYEFAVSEINQLCKNNRYQLVETLASEASQLLLDLPKVTQVWIKVGKPNILSTKQISIKIHRRNLSRPQR